METLGLERAARRRELLEEAGGHVKTAIVMGRLAWSWEATARRRRHDVELAAWWSTRPWCRRDLGAWRGAP